MKANNANSSSPLHPDDGGTPERTRFRWPDRLLNWVVAPYLREQGWAPFTNATPCG